MQTVTPRQLPEKCVSRRLGYGMVSMRAFEQKLPVVRGRLRASTGVVTGRGAGKAVVGLVSPAAVDG